MVVAQKSHKLDSPLVSISCEGSVFPMVHTLKGPLEQSEYEEWGTLGAGDTEDRGQQVNLTVPKGPYSDHH